MKNIMLAICAFLGIFVGWFFGAAVFHLAVLHTDAWFFEPLIMFSILGGIGIAVLGFVLSEYFWDY